MHFDTSWLSWEETLVRLTVAAVLGGLVGLERQRHDWAAGIRTHMLVCLGSALMMLVSSFGFSDILSMGKSNVNLDVSRVAAQVVSGIGFLGAGTIMFLKDEVVKGLTTAAGLWTVAGVGLAVGGGMYFAAIMTTVLVLVVLILVQPAKQKIAERFHPRELQLFVNREDRSVKSIEAIAKEHNLSFYQMSILHTESDDDDIVQVKFSRHVSHDSLLTFMDALKELKGISEMKLKLD